jgi:SAM-dependent methyltransferase
MATAPEQLTPPAPCCAPFQVLQVRPAGYAHAAALTELAECVYFGLRRLGLAVQRDGAPGAARQIVIGAHLLDAPQLRSLPADAILYNSEQISGDSPWLGGPYLTALRTQPVWDYSAANVRRLAALGVRALHVPLGYVPELARIAPAVQDIDVLFYGSVNARRQKILDELRARGLKVVTLFGAYGEERDQAIARARVVLSVHFYDAKIFEIVRAAYLFTNEKAVVAECAADSCAEEAELGEAMCAVPYERLVATCLALVQDEARRAQLARRAHRIFAGRREEDILAAALELSAPPARSAAGHLALPATLQLGSGKDFRPDCFNLDINPAWGPDAVADICAAGLIGTTLATRRFGSVHVEAESFEAALAHDVLEHLADLPTAMSNVLRLLKPGGLFEILVPYDLGLGAWQDPTHVRAFNERSWLYYTDWHWYLGWTEARFDTVLIELKPSPFGAELQRAGQSSEQLLRTPRAVDALHVVLRKRYLQESERREALARQPGAQR